MKKETLKKIVFYLAPLLVILIFAAEFFRIPEKLILSAGIIFIGAVPFSWFSGSTLKKTANTTIFIFSILLCIFLTTISQFDILGGELKARYFSISDFTLYYAIEDAHFYEETNLRLMSFNFNGHKEISTDFYTYALGDLKLKKKDGQVTIEFDE